MIYRSSIEVQSPLAISLRRATGNDIDTRLAISGTVVRGALAHAYMEGGMKPEEQPFQDLFLNSLVCFGEHRFDFSHPWPLSLRRCVNKAQEHPLMDMLLLSASRQPIELHCTAPDCQSKREHPTGFYVAEIDGHRDAEIKTRRVAHTSINPRFLRAETAQFHSSSVISEKQMFGGYIRAQGQGQTLLAGAIGKGKTLYAGRGRSRGQGRLLLRMHEDEAEGWGEIRQRIEALNGRARGYLALRGKVLFSVTLPAGAILFDEWLQPRYRVCGADVSRQLVGFECLASFYRGQEIAGWNAAAGLPKSGAGAITAGACFLFGKTVADAGRAAAYDELAGVLATAQEHGIGERREEGFGEITFCDSIHYETAADA